MSVFSTPASWTNSPIRVAVVGVGGTGSQIVTGLSRLHIAMLSLGHPCGLEVCAWDGDNVSPANIGRQLFSPGDIGRNKAAVLINRINAYFGLHWAARSEKFSLRSHDKIPHLVITCVDTAAARREIFEYINDAAAKRHTPPSLWLDCGNSQKSGQVMLGKFSEKHGGDLPLMEQLLPEIFDPSIPEDNRPSCSLAEALESQDLFINQAIATYAGQLLWTLIRQGELSICGYWINLAEGRVVPEPIARKRKAL
jgi:PRTRC genetic system ThiF family protein